MSDKEASGENPEEPVEAAAEGAAPDLSAASVVFSDDDPIANLSVGHLSKLIAAQVETAIGRQIGRGGLAGSHVNSGPPGFVNGGGHANFDPKTRFEGDVRINPGSLAGSHVNSGPPGFVNGGGHANFDPKARFGGDARINPGSLAGSHVNSGPPGFVNGGGHANFDPKTRFGGDARINPGSLAGSHVNSGPPGFVNGGGHANFDPHTVLRADLATLVTLPDGGQVRLPATGPVDITVRGMRITR